MICLGLMHVLPRVSLRPFEASQPVMPCRGPRGFAARARMQAGSGQAGQGRPGGPALCWPAAAPGPQHTPRPQRQQWCAASMLAVPRSLRKSLPPQMLWHLHAIEWHCRNDANNHQPHCVAPCRGARGQGPWQRGRQCERAHASQGGGAAARAGSSGARHARRCTAAALGQRQGSMQRGALGDAGKGCAH